MPRPYNAGHVCENWLVQSHPKATHYGPLHLSDDGLTLYVGSVPVARLSPCQTQAFIRLGAERHPYTTYTNKARKHATQWLGPEAVFSLPSVDPARSHEDLMAFAQYHLRTLHARATNKGNLHNRARGANWQRHTELLQAINAYKAAFGMGN